MPYPSRTSGGSGDPSPFTAYGTLQGIKACLQRRFGSDDPGKLSFAVQGVGHVGYYLTKYLTEAGAKVFVCDINESRVERAVDELGDLAAHGAERVGQPMQQAVTFARGRRLSVLCNGILRRGCRRRWRLLVCRL